MVKIKVFIATHKKIETDNFPCSVLQTKAIFDSSEHNIDIHVFNSNVNKKYNHDYSMIKNSLKKVEDDVYTIICKDTCVSTMPANTLIHHLHRIIEKDDFDIMWMANWLDQCQKYSNLRHVSLTGVGVVDTYSPHGIQCLMFSPEGRRKFLKIKPLDIETPLSEYLNRSVKSGKFLAITFQPCPISFDINKAERPIDYVKSCQCADPPGPIHPDKPGSDIGFFIFIVIGIFVFICINLLIKFGIYMSNHYDYLVSKINNMKPKQYIPE